MKRCLLLILCILVGCTPTSYESLDSRDYDFGDLTLGLAYVPDANETYRKFTSDHLEALNVSHVRMGFLWKFREPQRNHYDDEDMIERLAFYNDRDCDVLMTIDLKHLPEWSKGLTREEFIEEYSELVDHIMSRFANDITRIQLGNEWDWEIDQYLAGDLDLFIEMTNILHAKAEGRVQVVLGSISIGGLRALAFEQGLISNVTFKKGPLYSEEEIEAYSQQIDITVRYADAILHQCVYDLVDIHLYDDYWQWSLYYDAYIGMMPKKVMVIASEFGGPNPKMEPEEDSYRANQLYYYVDALKKLDIETAYYFKLVEDQTGSVFHPYSFLVSADGKGTKTYEVFRSYMVD